MKVFAFSPCYLSSAGDGVHERRLAQALCESDQLFIATFNIIASSSQKFKGKIVNNEDSRLIKLPIVRPIILFSLFYGIMLSCIFSFYRLMGRKPFDVLYVRDVPVAICLIMFRKWHKMPVVTKIVHFAADEYFKFPKKIMFRFLSWVIVTMEKFATIRADSVLVPSELFKTELANRYGVSKNRIDPLSSGVDIKLFSSSFDFRIPGSQFTIGYFGSLGCLHDIDCLFKALQLLKSKANIKLVISTKDDPTEVLQNITKYHLNELVELRSTPYVLMPKIMNEVDVVVIPRRKLSSTDLVLPLKLMEAGAAKKPVIIAKTKIIRSELKDNQQVLMYEPGDATDLSEKILELYNNRPLRYSLGKELFDYVQEFDWHNISWMLRNILNEVSNGLNQQQTSSIIQKSSS